MKNLYLSISFFISCLISTGFFYYVTYYRDNRPVKYVVLNPDGSSSRAPENRFTDLLIGSSQISIGISIILLYLALRYLVIFIREVSKKESSALEAGEK